jgi:hypothetical protein
LESGTKKRGTGTRTAGSPTTGHGLVKKYFYNVNQQRLHPARGSGAENARVISWLLMQ